MPKRGLPAVAVAPVAVLAPPTVSPLVQKLRTDWRWAGISQFLWTFSDAFGLVDWDIEALEADLDRDETALLPEILLKLLYALTYNRNISRESVFDHLTKQYLRRAPERNPLGSEEEPIQWATLGLGQKVQALWDLCEWQLDDPARFRALLKSEEEATSWRVEPIGWDKSGNTYFLFDDNRLWIQRLPPRPPPPPRPAKKSSVKAKRAQKRARASNAGDSSEPRKSHKKRAVEAELTPPPPAPKQEEEVILTGPRRRTQVAFYGNPTPTASALKRGGPPAAETPSSGSKITRSSTRNQSGGGLPTSKSAQSLAEATPSKASSTARPAPLPRGTRVSRRLREVADEWQAVPDEWLQPGESSKAKPANGRSTRNGKKSAVVDDDDSELSELTEEEEAVPKPKRAAAKSASTREPSLTPLSTTSSSVSPLTSPEDEDAMDVDDHPKDGAEQAPEADEELEEGDKSKADGPEDAAQEQEQGTAGTSKTEDDTEPGAGTQNPKAETEAMPEAKEETPPTGEKAEPEEVALGESGSQADAKSEAKAEATSDAEIEIVAEPKQEQEALTEEPEEEEETDEVKLAVKEAANLPEGFVEWEAICVSLYDWRTFPETFAKSRDADERNLYHVLSQQVAPVVIEALVVKEQERLKQEAINNRKRSSRIATRELEKEELLRREQAQREMEERMEKMRSEEKRKIREEEEARARETAREDRLKEREERLAAREKAILQRAIDEQEAKDKADQAREERSRRRELGLPPLPAGENDSARSTPGASSAKGGNGKNGAAAGGNGERWELNCEVCRKNGWNMDEEQDLVCCDDCGRWQHVECHDRQDAAEGRRPRNWDAVDFKCKECRRRAARMREKASHPQMQEQSREVPHPGAARPTQNGHGSSAPGHHAHAYPTAPHPLHPAAPGYSAQHAPPQQHPYPPAQHHVPAHQPYPHQGYAPQHPGQAQQHGQPQYQPRPHLPPGAPPQGHPQGYPAGAYAPPRPPHHAYPGQQLQPHHGAPSGGPPYDGRFPPMMAHASPPRPMAPMPHPDAARIPIHPQQSVARPPQHQMPHHGPAHPAAPPQTGYPQAYMPGHPVGYPPHPQYQQGPPPHAVSGIRPQQSPDAARHHAQLAGQLPPPVEARGYPPNGPHPGQAAPPGPIPRPPMNGQAPPHPPSGQYPPMHQR